MQSSAIFAIIAAATMVVASPAVYTARGAETTTGGAVVSEAEFAHWLATTDAELTFIGEPINPLAKRAAQSTQVTYCTKRIGPICGGSCTVYNGGATCLNAAGTTCMTATRDIGFCDLSGCDGNCNALSLCGTVMPNGFCFTPQAMSILVSSL